MEEGRKGTTTRTTSTTTTQGWLRKHGIFHDADGEDFPAAVQEDGEGRDRGSVQVRGAALFNASGAHELPLVQSVACDASDAARAAR